MYARFMGGRETELVICRIKVKAVQQVTQAGILGVEVPDHCDHLHVICVELDMMPRPYWPAAITNGTSSLLATSTDAHGLGHCKLNQL